MLNPAGTFSFAVGSLSAAAGIGGGATGASFAAASLSAERPIKGEPGGSGAPAAGGAGLAAGGVAGCWAAALNVNALKKAPASQRLRDADLSLFMDVLPDGSPLPRSGTLAACPDRLSRRQSPIFFRRMAIGNKSAAHTDRRNSLAIAVYRTAANDRNHSGRTKGPDFGVVTLNAVSRARRAHRAAPQQREIPARSRRRRPSPQPSHSKGARRPLRSSGVRES